jgi:ribosomal protein L31
MKKGIHPDNYRMVAFKDMSNGDTFITRSTVNIRRQEVIACLLHNILIKLRSDSEAFLFLPCLYSFLIDCMEESQEEGLGYTSSHETLQGLLP